MGSRSSVLKLKEGVNKNHVKLCNDEVLHLGRKSPFQWQRVIVFPKQLLLRDWLGNQSAGCVDCFCITSFFPPSFPFSSFPASNLPLSQSTSLFLNFVPPVLSPNPLLGVNEAEWELNHQLGLTHHKHAAQSRSWSPGCFWDLTEQSLEQLCLTSDLILLWAGSRTEDLMRSIPVWLVLWFHALQLLLSQIWVSVTNGDSW